MLLIGPLCVGAFAQSPRGNRPPGQHAAPSQPHGMPAPLPQYDVPPATRPRTLGLSTLPPASQYATPAAATMPRPNGPGGSPSAADEQSPAAAGGLRARFPKFFDNVRNATMTPGQKLAQQAEAQAAQNARPLAAAPGRLVRAQQQVALPQGPVIVYMPAGWQPPQDITFAPRTMSPEVPENFWPASTRNPLGEISGNGGLFRWPKFTRPNSPDELPVEKPLSKKALLASSEAEPGDDSRTVATKRAWNSLLGTTSGEAARSVGGRKPAKALFAGVASSNPPRRNAMAPARTTASSAVARPQPPAGRVVNRQMAQPPAPSVTRAPHTQTQAAAPQSASRLRSTVLADLRPSATENTPGQLKWRAKGAPRVGAPPVDNSRAQMATHVQPVDPTPSPAAPPAPPATYPAVPQQQPAPAAAQAPAPAPVARQKSLIPKSVWKGTPATPGPTPAQAPAQPAPQPPPPAGMTTMAPQPAVQAGTPNPANNATATGVKPLFPNMFATPSPRTVGLTTKPPTRSAVSTPTPVQPVYVVLSPQASAKMMESYYAPPKDEAPAPKTSSRRKQPNKPRAEERPRAEKARSKPLEYEPKPSRQELARAARAREAAQRAQAPSSPLEKPLRAISEMTKLPKFITGETSGRTRPPAFRERYRATVARRADRRGRTDRTIRAEQLADDHPDELESDVAPDVSVDLPSQKSPAQAKPRSRSESPQRSNNNKELTARQELDRLYQAAMADRDEATHETADDAIEEPEESISAGARDEYASPDNSAAAEADDQPAPRTANVPAAAIEQSAGPANPEPQATRIRKSDGSSVVVYHLGSTPAEAQDEQEGRAASVANSPRSKSPVSRSGKAVRQSEGTVRRNPLR